MIRPIKVSALAVLIASLLVMSGCAGDIITDNLTNSKQVTTEKTQPKETKQSAETIKKDATIYVPTEDGKGVKAEKLSNVDTSKPKNILTAVIKADSEMKYPLFPKNLTVNDVVVKDHVATVDFSKEFLTLNQAGSLTTSLVLAAIVNTLTEQKDIQGVIITVEGKRMDTLGPYDLTSELKRMDSKIVK